MIASMADDRPKSDTHDDPEIDPKLKEKKPDTGTSQPPVNPGGQRRENETDSNRADDGARKRAEEGL